jgi:hypothetical protein
MPGPLFLSRNAGSTRSGKEIGLARSSYTFEKRRKELAKKKRNEEKLERKRARKGPLTPENPVAVPEETQAVLGDAAGDASAA